METVGVTTQNEFVLRMRQVYVDVSVRRRPLHDSAGEPTAGTVNPPPGEGRRQTLRSFLDDGESQVFAVVGGPGSGKTTLARHTALSLSEPTWRFWRRRPLPLLLYLRNHIAELNGESPPTLGELAASVGWLSGKISAGWLEKRLHQGGCVVLLDGLDEVADERDRGRVVTWVERQIQRDPENTYVITSRPHGYSSRPLANAEVLQVRRFTGEQISDFLYGWYRAVEGRAQNATGAQVRADADTKAKDLLERLKDRLALHDLAANPLLLTMIANVHRFRGKLPGTRAELYAEMCDVLVHRRYEVRGLTDATGLRGRQKEQVLRHLALAMMRARLRVIPADEACGAIADPLNDIALSVKPAMFLEEVRKSGLLVEHEHGFYAFAHLTLQEHLAAAGIGREHTELLTSHVEDPWWRETTLLWAANARDATPVVEACLASGTVRALALAFDCVDEAVVIARDIRQRLEEILASPDGDEERHRLINGIAAARSLREVIPLDGDAALCKRPVPRHLWARFVDDEAAAGGQTSGCGGESPHDEAPATGMSADDAARFVSWMNGLFEDGTSYRLPTADEVVDSPVDLLRHTVWTFTPGASDPSLHQPDGAHWPYELDLAELHRYPAADRVRLSTYLRVALAPDPYFASSRGHVLAQALNDAAHFGDSPDLRPSELLLHIVRVRILARILERAQVGNSAGALIRDPVARDLTVALVRDLGRLRDRDRNRTHDLLDDGDLDLACELASVPDRAPSLVRFLDGLLARALDRAVAHPSFDFFLVPDLDLARDGTQVGNRFSDRVLDLALTHLLDLLLVRDLDPALVLDPAHSLNVDVVHELGLDPVADIDRVLASDSARGLDLTLDLTLALALTLSSGVRPRMPVAALRSLLALWTPPDAEPGLAETLAHFDTFLNRVPSEPTRTMAHASENPTALLRQARELIGSHPDIDTDTATANFLLTEVAPLVGATLNPATPHDSTTLPSARTGLLAATALLRRHQRHDAAELVERAWRSLIALERRSKREVLPNEVLLLVRA